MGGHLWPWKLRMWDVGARMWAGSSPWSYLWVGTGSGSLLKGTSPHPRCRTRGHLRRQCEQPTQHRRWHPSHSATPHLGSGFYLAGVEAINRLDQLPGLAAHLAPLLGRCQAHKQRGYGTALLLPTPLLLLSSQRLCMKIIIIYIKLSEPILNAIPLSLGQYLSFYCFFIVFFFFLICNIYARKCFEHKRL